MNFDTKRDTNFKFKSIVCVETNADLINKEQTQKQKTQKIFTFSALENELKFISYNKTDIVNYSCEVENIFNNQEEVEVVVVKTTQKKK